MKILKKLDGALRPVRLIAALMAFCWFGSGTLLMLTIDLPWIASAFGVMALISIAAVLHHARHQYWYHSNE